MATADIGYYSQDQQWQILASPLASITSSPSGASWSFFNKEEEWDILVDGDNNVIFNGQIIEPDQPLAGKMRLVKQLRIEGIRPNNDELFRRYRSHRVTLSPNTNLYHKYILQQLITLYDDSSIANNDGDRITAVKALLARYRVLRGVNRLVGLSNDQLMDMASIAPYPEELLDLFLDVRAIAMSAEYEWLRKCCIQQH